jgi:hypothetical protein
MALTSLVSVSCVSVQRQNNPGINLLSIRELVLDQKAAGEKETASNKKVFALPTAGAQG